MVTSLIFLHPELASWALFKFLSLHKLHKFFVLFRSCMGYLILFTGHARMPFYSTVQAILFSALRTLKPIFIFLIKEKHVFTIYSWAPRTIFNSIKYIVSPLRSAYNLRVFFSYFWYTPSSKICFISLSRTSALHES